eukprot:TRINITY_DN7568_c0_g1_i1.p1 TRINITY_DN7568_c0_g1~~TRINITY_DN7568_c0_g1_i1.p1  ORF type:complete len:593 (+),score=114.92 TRINITY_DN7568_c0_g1_i1:1-1779(+)
MDHNCTIGEFQCIAYLDPALNQIFAEEVKNRKNDLSHCYIYIEPIDIAEMATTTNKHHHSIFHPHRRDDDTSTDERVEVKIGSQHQVDLARALHAEDLEFNHSDRGGRLVWDPSTLEESQVVEFLEKTRMPIEFDSDDFTKDIRDAEEGYFILKSNTESESMDPTAQNRHTIAEITEKSNELIINIDETSLIPCTQEDVLGLLRKNDYDVKKTIKTLRDSTMMWSGKHRGLVKWTKAEVDNFERGMKNYHDNSNRFQLIKRNELSKSSKSRADIVHFYYIWKKLPRYIVWQMKRKLSSSALSSYNTYSIPLKNEEQSHRLDPRLRSRPRIDYSQSSSGSHLWHDTTTAPTQVEVPEVHTEITIKKRKHSELETGGAREKANTLNAFNIEIFVDIDFDQVREIKRRRCAVLDPKLVDEIDKMEDSMLISPVSSPLSHSSGDDMVESITEAKNTEDRITNGSTETIRTTVTKEKEEGEENHNKEEDMKKEKGNDKDMKYNTGVKVEGNDENHNKVDVSDNEKEKENNNETKSSKVEDSMSNGNDKAKTENRSNNEKDKEVKEKVKQLDNAGLNEKIDEKDASVTEGKKTETTNI